MPTVAIGPNATGALDNHDLETEAGVEFANGRIVEKPVSVESAEIEATIIFLLSVEARGTREARVFGPSMGYKCFPSEPERFRKPDVSVVRADRLAGTDPQDGFIYVPPDLAVEVISPTELAYDVDAKIDEYLSNGFPLVWVVYPTTKSVVVRRADGSVAIFRGQDEITGEGALPGFKCPVATFFGPTR